MDKHIGLSFLIDIPDKGVHGNPEEAHPQLFWRTLFPGSIGEYFSANFLIHTLIFSSKILFFY